MADQVKNPGRLIAIDGTRGKDTAAAARAVMAALKQRHIECAISRFDASGLFGELAAAGREGKNLSARTLTLVYAADLAFRLRWEIRPVLEAGGMVIAAPYLDSAIAIGAAHGLNAGWIRDLLRFAPAPHFRARADEKRIDKRWKARLNRGYGEYCAALLDSKGHTKARRARKDAIALLQRARGRGLYQLQDADVTDLVRAVTGTATATRSKIKKRSAT